VPKLNWKGFPNGLHWPYLYFGYGNIVMTDFYSHNIIDVFADSSEKLCKFS